MDEIEIVHRISELVEDEHALEREHAGTPPSDEQVARLRAIEVALDQCWDLLRQRRARRDAGAGSRQRTGTARGSGRGLPTVIDRGSIGMTESTASTDVRDDRDGSRFVLEEDGSTAELIYLTEPGRLILIHTEVPEALGGRGIGGRLVRAALGRAKAEQLTIVPWCPFARKWLTDHADAAGAVDIDWATMPSTGERNDG